eukprot:280079_1
MDIEKYKQLALSNIEPLWKYKIFRYTVYTSSAITSALILRKMFDLMKRRYYNLPPACTYGGISMFYIGPTRIIAIHDSKLILKHFKDPSFLNVHPTKNAVGNLGDLNGKQWQKRRKLLSNSFIGNQQLHSVNLSQYINKCLQQHIFKNIITNKDYYMCRSDMKYIGFSTIHHVIFMQPLSMNKYIKVKDNVMKLFDMIAFSMIINWFFGFSDFGHRMSIKLAPVEPCAVMLDNVIIKEWMYTNNLNKNSYLSILLHTQNGLTQKQISREIQVLFTAGLHAMALAMELAIVFAAKYPKAQDRTYKDLKRYFGNGDMFSLKYIKELNEFRAFVMETLRFSTTCIASLPRYIMVDKGVNVSGYNIPKGSVVIADYATNNMSERLWKKGKEFDIENHLNEKGKFVQRMEMFSFGRGRRDCPGKALAIKFLYIALGSLFLSYKFDMYNVNDFDDISTRYSQQSRPETPVRVTVRK